MESEIHVPLTKILHLVPGIRNTRRQIQNPRLDWIPLHEVKYRGIMHGILESGRKPSKRVGHLNLFLVNEKKNV